MKVRNKLESIKFIKQLKLNCFPEKLFSNEQVSDILSFLKENPAKYYAVRSKEIVGCKKNNFKCLEKDILNEIKNFNLFTINVSSYNYTSDLILIGDIMISSNNKVWFIGSTNPEFTGKMAEVNPEFNLAVDIFDKRLDSIPEFDFICDYIISHKLLDVIVEFALYTKPLGIYNERIIIFEIRTEF